MKKLLNFLERHATKLLLVGIIGFIVLMFVFDGTISDMLPMLAVLLCMALAVLGAVGCVLKVFHKLANGVKSLSKKISKKFGKSSAKRNKGNGIITLTAQTGEEIDFTEIAGIVYGGNFYAILQPVKLLEGMSADEALVFRVTRDSRGEDHFEIELNDSIIDAVFKEYDKLLEAERRKHH